MDVQFGGRCDIAHQSNEATWKHVASHDSWLKRISLRLLLDNWPDRCMFANILDFVKDSDKPIAEMKVESRHDNTYSYLSLIHI